jgi:hypothetical protein
MNKGKLWALLIAALLLAATVAGAAQTKASSKPAPSKAASADKPKEHQATGKVVSFNATSLVISKGVGKKTSDWPFVLNAKTRTQGMLAKNAKVTVHYHQDKDQKIADRIKVWEAASEAKPAAKSKSSKTKS